jgi:type IV pilus assembly protein PilE
MKDIIMNKKRGLTIIELLIVVVVLGILAALALPRFLEVQARAKASEAKGMLRAALVLEKGYYNQHGHYSASLEDIGFIQVPLVTDDPPGKARYRIAIPVATDQDLRVTATSVVDFDADGQYSVWIINQAGLIEEQVPD